MMHSKWQDSPYQSNDSSAIKPLYKELTFEKKLAMGRINLVENCFEELFKLIESDVEDTRTFNRAKRDLSMAIFCLRMCIKERPQ